MVVMASTGLSTTPVPATANAGAPPGYGDGRGAADVMAAAATVVGALCRGAGRELGRGGEGV